MVLVSGVVYGLQPLMFSQCYSQGANPVFMTIARNGAIAILLFPVVLRKGGGFRVVIQHWKEFLCLCFVNMITGVLLYGSYLHIATSIATSLHFLYPVIVTLLCLAVFHDKASPRKLFCTFLCLVGTAFILNLTERRISLMGVALAAGSSFTWALYIVWLDKLDLKDVSSEQLLFFITGGSCVLIAAVYHSSLPVTIAAITPVGWAFVALASVLVGLFGSIFFAVGVRCTDAQTSAIASTLEPVVSVAVGILLMKEAFSLSTLIGSLCIVVAVFILALPPPQKHAP